MQSIFGRAIIAFMVTNTARADYMRRVHHLYQFVDNDGLCVYCGEFADTKDHFTPVSAMAIFESLRRTARGAFLFPACRNCNSIASNKVFKTVGQKRRYIQERLLEKYGNILYYAEWTDEELDDDIGPSLRLHILRGQFERDKLRRRIAWRNTRNPTNAFIATIRLQPTDAGQNSVQQKHVARIITLKKEKLRSPSQLLKALQEKRSRVNMEFLKIMIAEYGEEKALEVMRETRENQQVN